MNTYQPDYQPDLRTDPEDPARVAERWEAKLSQENGAAYAWPPSGQVVQWGRQWADRGELPADLPDPLRAYAEATATPTPQPRTGGPVSMRFTPETLPSHDELKAARRALAEQEGEAGPAAPASPWPASRVALRWLRVLQYGAAGVLLERYLAEIHPVPRANALRAERRRGARIIDPAKVDDPNLWGRLRDLAEYRRLMVPEPEAIPGDRPTTLADLPPLDPDAPPPVGMNPDDAEAARDEVARLTAHPGPGWSLARERELSQRMQGWLRPATPQEQEDAYLRYLGAQEDGTRRPTLREYLHATGWSHLADVALSRLRMEARQEEQEGRAEDGDELVDLELDEAMEAAERVHELGNRVAVPQGIRSAIGPLRTQARGALQRAESGQLTLYDAESRAALKQWADADMDLRQLAELSALHWRALWGTLHVFSSRADDKLWPDYIVVPWKTMCAAAQIDARQTTQARDLYQSLDELDAMQVHTMIRTDSGLYATRVPLVKMVARWKDQKRNRTAQRKLAEYRKTGTWTGPPPDEVTLRLGDPMRYTVKAMALPADLLTRLKDAAQEVRGANQGVKPLDMLLYFELTRPGPRQKAHTTPDGIPYSYLERERFLDEVNGEKATKARSRGPTRYQKRIVEPYLRAVDVLLRAGVVRDWIPGYQARNGKRDRFEVPDLALP